MCIPPSYIATFQRHSSFGGHPAACSTRKPGTKAVKQSSDQIEGIGQSQRIDAGQAVTMANLNLPTFTRRVTEIGIVVNVGYLFSSRSRRDSGDREVSSDNKNNADCLLSLHSNILKKL